LLLLMKQARAMGLGVLLATQNPVDMDYKAVSNAGLWCIGRLRAKQDRERLLAGIPGEGLDGIVESLDKRAFLVARASGETAVVKSRHAMCYLRGPFTRAEVARFTAEQGAAPPPRAAAPRTAAAVAPPPVHEGLRSSPPPVEVDHFLLDPRVVFSARMEGHFSGHAEPRRDDGRVVFRPALYAELALRFDEDRVGFVLDETHHRVWFPLVDELPETHLPLRLEDHDLLDEPPEDALFADLPDWMDEAKELKRLQKQVVDDVYRGETAGMFVNKKLKLYGRGGESAEDFAVRCEAAVQELVDAGVAKLKDTYERRTDALDKRIRDAEARVVQLRSEERGLQAEAALGIGETVLSWFSGRSRSLSAAASRGRRAMTAGTRTDAAEDKLEDLMADAEELQVRLQEDVEEIRAKHAVKLEATEEREVRLEKADIHVERFGILWVPVTRRA
jgi:hypothetical protein